MGLSLSVGYLADVSQGDPDAAAEVRRQFGHLNEFLHSRGLPLHEEPDDVDPLSCSMYGYSGLHYLRRIAAHLAAGRPLPPPGDEKASKDPVLLTRYARNNPPGTLARHLGRISVFAHRFDHLIEHSDAEGYYLPRAFKHVLLAEPPIWKIPGALIGSALRLKEDCEALAHVIELPLDLDPESEEVWSATESQGEGERLWQRYGIESFTCLQLHAAANHALKTGAAVVFC